MTTLQRTIICLFRNDLRIHDNECLHWAYQNSDYIIPLFCFQPNDFKDTYHFHLKKCGIHRAKFLTETVSTLRENLEKLGSNLVIRNKQASEAIDELIDLCSNAVAPVKQVVLQKEITSEEIDEEKEIELVCQKYGVEVKSFWGLTLFHRDDIPFNKNQIPDTYTKFRQSVELNSNVRPIIPKLLKLQPLPPVKGANVGTVPTLRDLNFNVDEVKLDDRTAFPFSGGETSGLDRLHEYLWDTDCISTYKETRNGLLEKNYSTKFSPWLANGSLSPRQIYHEVKKYEKKRTANQSTYWCIFELLWRDYFKFVAWKYGNRIFYLSGIMGKKFEWRKDTKLFDKWCRGETGVPFVDANMRELLQTGWMSNRGRQNVASFLVKDLKLDWRLGAEWFESMLLDHDVCSNYGNWNYAAGIGNDPRQDRKFNMIKQALDYDPDGEFVKVWLTELKDVNKSKVHFPWTIPKTVLKQSNVTIGVDYPEPVIVAPEWNRHTRKTSDKIHPKPNTKTNRGIDFYFKSSTKK